jgi:hypothetical protein
MLHLLVWSVGTIVLAGHAALFFCTLKMEGVILLQDIGIYIYIYILRSFKPSDDAFCLSYSIAFDCSIHPFLDLFHTWLYIFHISMFSGDGLIVSFLQVSSEGHRYLYIYCAVLNRLTMPSAFHIPLPSIVPFTHS